MRVQILVQAPGENLANTRLARVTIDSSPGLNQIAEKRKPAKAKAPRPPRSYSPSPKQSKWQRSAVAGE
jgi:hypothetical protein